MAGAVFRFLSFLSLVLLIAIAVLWARSYFTVSLLLHDVRKGNANYTTGYLKSGDGCLYAQWIRYPELRGIGARSLLVNWSARSDPLTNQEQLDLQAPLRFMNGGFRVGPYGYGYLRGAKVPQSRVALPYWTMAVLMLVFPSARLWKRGLRSRRMRKNCCSQCGYDLRATPERCPECGTPVPSRYGAAQE